MANLEFDGTHRPPDRGPMKIKSSNDRPKETLTVLVVDDYEDNRQMYGELLAYAGYQVAEARDGAEALGAALRILPDLIVMDLSLPVVDGWEATRRLKGDDRTRHIPILALTGHAPEGLAGHSESAHEAGCDGFLAKPCSPERLLESVDEILALARTRRSVHKVRVGRRTVRKASGG
jgi:two-component system cell cycle response regulator DivK